MGDSADNINALTDLFNNTTSGNFNMSGDGELSAIGANAAIENILIDTTEELTGDEKRDRFAQQADSLKSVINGQNQTAVDSIKTNLANYSELIDKNNMLNDIIEKKRAQLAQLDSDIEIGISDIDTNKQRIMYETNAMDTINYMRILIYIIYSLVSVLFIANYILMNKDDKSIENKIKILFIIVIISVIAVFPDKIVSGLNYIYKLPKSLFPDATP
uniref:Uncharacterized protein n=1 Tax=viral metagenome TaxID=1070528 RepID=A0A6C0BTV2_9ZZZZ